MYGLSEEDRQIQARARGFADELIPLEEEAEFAGALGVRGAHVGGQFAAVAFGLFLERDQLVGETVRPRLDGQIFL